MEVSYDAEVCRDKRRRKKRKMRKKREGEGAATAICNGLLNLIFDVQEPT